MIIRHFYFMTFAVCDLRRQSFCSALIVSKYDSLAVLSSFLHLIKQQTSYLFTFIFVSVRIKSYGKEKREAQTGWPSQ